MQTVAQAWLAAFPSLNPYSAAALAGQDLCGRCCYCSRHSRQALAHCISLPDWALGARPRPTANIALPCWQHQTLLLCCSQQARFDLDCLVCGLELHQEALVKSLPEVSGTSLRLFFQQVSSSTLQPVPAHAAHHQQHIPPGPSAAGQQRYQQQDQRILLQQQQFGDEPGWRCTHGRGREDAGTYEDCCQDSPPPQWPPPERYQVLIDTVVITLAGLVLPIMSAFAPGCISHRATIGTVRTEACSSRRRRRRRHCRAWSSPCLRHQTTPATWLSPWHERIRHAGTALLQLRRTSCLFMATMATPQCNILLVRAVVVPHTAQMLGELVDCCMVGNPTWHHGRELLDPIVQVDSRTISSMHGHIRNGRHPSCPHRSGIASGIMRRQPHPTPAHAGGPCCLHGRLHAAPHNVVALVALLSFNECLVKLKLGNCCCHAGHTLLMMT